MDTNLKDHFILAHQVNRVRQLFWSVQCCMILVVMVCFLFNLEQAGTIMLCCIVSTAPIYFLIKKHTKLALGLLISILLLAVQAVFWMSYGLKSAAIYGFPILLMLTIFFNQRQMFWAFFVVIILSIYLNAFMYGFNILDNHFAKPTLGRSIIYIVCVTLFAVLLRFFYTDMILTIKNLRNEKKRLMQSKKSISQLDHHDPLTQLADRMLAKDFYDRCVDKRAPNELIAVCIVDLDKFKQINDAYGFDIGDQVLKNTTQAIRQFLTQADGIFKVGGDEFLLILPKIKGLSQLDDKLIEIVAIVNQCLCLDNKNIKINGSIGVATTPKDGMLFDGLVAKADLALIDAKRSGGGCFEKFFAQMLSKQRNKIEIIQSINQFIAQKKITLQYVPIHLVANQLVTGVKVEINYTHDELGKIPHNQLLSYLTRSGKMGQLWKWKLQEVQSMMGALRDQGFYHLDVYITTPSELILSNQVFEILKSQWNEYGLPFNHMVLLLDDTVFTDLNPVLFENIQQLHQLGVRFAVSSYGFKMTDLTRLKLHFLEYMFFDGSFIESKSGKVVDEMMQNAILTMLKALKIKSCINVVQMTSVDDQRLWLLDLYLNRSDNIISRQQLIRYLFEHNNDLVYDQI